jgi:hypothetical protein
MPETPEELSNEIQDLLQEAVLKSYPNPERKGCPGERVVLEVAARLRPVQDEPWEHISHCSPCFREFLEFRQVAMTARKRLVRRNRLMLASVVVAAGIGGVVFWTGGSRLPAPPTTVAAVIKVDLRPFGPARSEVETAPQSKPLAATLNRQAVRLVISLPVGSDEGKYEVRVMDSELHPVMSNTASTAFTDHVATLSVAFDFSRLSAGSYVLGVHGPDGSWRTYPVAIR